MIERLSPMKRNLALGVLAALVAWFAWSIRSVLNPVLLGYLCAFILAPAVGWIEARGFKRRTAVNLTFVGGFLLAGLVLLVVVLQLRSLALEVYAAAKGGPPAAGRVEAPAEPGQEAVRERSFDERLQSRLDEFRDSMNEWGIPVPELAVETTDLRELARRFLEENEETTVQAAGRGVRFVTSFVGKLVSLAGLFLLLPLYAYYFLFVGKDVNEFVHRHLPHKDRQRITRVAGQIGEVVASFFRGRLGVCFVKGLILSVGLWAAGVDYAFLFGMLSGFLSVIPFFGPFLGFLLAFTVGILEHGVIGALVRTGIVFGVGELLEGYVLVPKILGDSLGLHPLVVFIALLAGGAALGMLGVIVALPVTAAGVILFKEFVQPALRAWADEERGASPG